MKKIAAAVLSAAVFAVFGQSFEDELSRVESWINATYQSGSLAYRSAKQKLQKIYDSPKNEVEKITELQKTFPMVFSAAEIENLIVMVPLTWKIHSLSLGYDIEEGAAMEAKTVDIVKELNQIEASHGNNKSEIKTNTRDKGFGVKGDASAGVGVTGSIDSEVGIKRFGDSPIRFSMKKSLDWFLKAKGGISGHYEKNSNDRVESGSVWSEKDQQMFQRNRERIYSMITQTAIKNRHLTFTVTLYNQTDSDIFFDLTKASIPVYMGDQSCNNPAKPFRVSTQQLKLRPKNQSGQDVVFRMELNTTSARELADFMMKDTPWIAFERGIIEIVDPKGKDMLTKRNDLPESDSSIVMLSSQAGAFSWKLRRYHVLGKKVTIGEACEAISQDVKKYKDPLFLKNETGGLASVSDIPFGFGRFRLQNLPNEIAFLEYRGKFYSEISASLLSEPVENDGFTIHIFDDKKRIEIQNPPLFQAYKTHLLEWIQKAAKQGDIEAQFVLGLLCKNGDEFLGIKPNHVEAVKWFRKAAEKEYAAAQNNLGDCYYAGEGVPQNYTEAVNWYRKAAEKGNVSAQWNLGFCYVTGEGVEKNPFEAVKWYRKAAEKEYAAAQNSLGLCYYAGKGVPQNYTEAVKWYRKAAEKGNVSAQRNLGFCYETGNGVEKDPSEAVNWYRMAADQDDSLAQTSLGECYYDGKGVQQDYNKAVQWYRKAAEQKNAKAQNYLGICYYNGKGVAENLKKAFEWCMKAARQDNSDAQYNIGFFYLNGYGVPKDEMEAINWFKKAADQGEEKAKEELQKLNQ